MHAFVFLVTAQEKARKHSERLLASLPAHITSMSFSSYQLIQMVAINLFAMFNAKRHIASTADTDNEKNDDTSRDEDKAYDIIFKLTGMNQV